jgi:response regulator RpfG family c-di-GMP phosphodiesterase
MMNRRVLFVDDEPHIVESIKRMIRKSFDVHTSTDPSEALASMALEPDFAIVVSDMRMPQMSGVDFLTAVRKARPDTIRIMLTGNQDQQTAAAAVNLGEVFRFLNKPCDVVALTNVLEQGLRQYQLLTAERDLLTRTLQGSIGVLVEALSIAKPEVFGSIDRIERKCSQLAEGLRGIEPWEMRAAARLSRLGWIGMSTATSQRIASGANLTDHERKEYNDHPQVGARLVGDIPRLETVAECILYQLKNFDGSGPPSHSRSGSEIPLGARVLRLVLAFDQLQNRGATDGHAVTTLRGTVGCFDPMLLDRLANLCQVTTPDTFRVHAAELESGMTIAEDVQSAKGILLVCRGQAVTPAIQRHLQYFHDLGTLSEPILVLRLPLTDEKADGIAVA